MWEWFISGLNTWDIVTFKWKIVSVDWAVGSHYYNAEYVEQLEVSNVE
jgi:hypothetical protein